jgi:hypothetical protein
MEQPCFYFALGDSFAHSRPGRAALSHMPGYLLDTNHLGHLVDPRYPLRAHLRTAIEAGDVFYIILPNS